MRIVGHDTFRIHSDEEINLLHRDYLVEPTDREEEAICLAVSYVNSLSCAFGTKRRCDIKRVFLLEPGSVEKLSQGRFRNGMANYLDRYIIVERSLSLAILSCRVAHEALHLNGFMTSVIDEFGESGQPRAEYMSPYRLGISMLIKQKGWMYFSYAEEALVAECAHRFFNTVLISHPLFMSEIKNTTHIKNWLSSYSERYIREERRDIFEQSLEEVLVFPKWGWMIERLSDPHKDDHYKAGCIIGYYRKYLESGDLLRERQEERKILHSVCKKISDSISVHVSPEEVLGLFAHAHFSGNYVPLARVVEKSLGRGAFRSIAYELGEKLV